MTMKILQVIPSVGPLRGGPSQVVLDMCRGLAKAGVDVTLATTDDNGPEHLDVPLGQMIDQHGYKVIYFRRTTSEYTFSWSITAWLARHIHDYDFLHTHAAFSYTPAVSAFWAAVRGVPYAITPHGILGQWGFQSRRSWAKRVSFALVEKQILNRARFVHATSPHEARELEQLGICAPIEMIYLGIDMPTIEQDTAADRERIFPGRQNQTIVLFLGRFHPIKGLDLLLPAFAQALRQQPNLLLALAGDGDEAYVAWLKAEVQRLEIENHVLWMGFLSGGDKRRALAGCDIFVLPSYSESFGVAVLEAASVGAPVIVSDQVAIHSEVAQSGAGIVVPCEVDALTHSMLKLAQDSSLRESMSANARALAFKKFSLDQVTSFLIRSYEQYGGNNR
jgi:glycosyltransferase involved in cell wall biosynthesis